MRDYRTVADEVAAEIERGVLEPGRRLPPQREFAHQRGIAASTASCVYAELTRRGLVIGEVGRGTFVLNAPARVRSCPRRTERGAHQSGNSLLEPAWV